MSDMLHPFFSNFSEVRWSAPDDATVEGQVSFAPISLRYVKANRRLNLRLTKLSAHETWSTSGEDAARVRERSLSGQGELVEVLTAFELDGGPSRQFRELKNIIIVPAPAQTDDRCYVRDDQDREKVPGPEGALFVEFEAYTVHGHHPDPALSLTVSMANAEFRRVSSLVHARSEEVSGVNIVLEAELFGDEPGLDHARNEGTVEYGMLRPRGAPLAFVPARLHQMTISFERSAEFCAQTVPSKQDGTVHPEKGGLPNDGFSIIARRLGWIIALLILIALTLLSGNDASKSAKRSPRMFAAITQPSILTEYLAKVAELGTQYGRQHHALRRPQSYILIHRVILAGEPSAVQRTSATPDISAARIS
jgi:hypothetical protein